ncbi:unnamed protein product [Chondrus crispus]|uniref:TBC1 domain family member 23 n=1 Tax=Chondrus crispus TaxID=2769 RepID=R7QT77_CHOCR|nr:unnamed protein product [Chondrus crispus]CDF40716.1 unnamed protein product [Chondrus crispus]|eukprot:XP_005711010.1 unnamed protein product [Chondrus crispus]
MLETSESRVFDLLKRMFKYFGRLLLYHDPELYWLLERHMMTPDLYATSWFVTLFARNFTVESVLALWDLLLLEDNPLGTSFFGIALLCSKREELLSVDESRIPETLMMLTANSPEEVRRLWEIGSKMRTVHTPPSFQRLMTDRLLQTPGQHTRVGLSAARAMQASVCLQTTPDDLVAGDANYFTWDCRTQDEYSAGHLAQAAFLPLDALRQADGKLTNETNEAARAELQAAVDLCEPLKDTSHICLVGSGVKEEDTMDINMLALYLTRIGIKYVSTLRGGFQEALHAATNSEDNLSGVELVDFDKKKYERARKARITAQAKRKHNAGRRKGSATREGHKYAGDGFATDDRKVDTTQDDSPMRTSGNLASERGSSSPSGMQSISSFLEKTDAEVSRALNKALSGMGLKYSLSTMSSRVSGEPTTPSSASTTSSYNPFSPNSIVSPESMGNRGSTSARGSSSNSSLKRTEGPQSKKSSGEPKSRRSRPCANGSRSWADGTTDKNLPVNSSPRSTATSPATPSPRPGVQSDHTNTSTESPSRQRQSSSGLFGGQKSPWGREAKPGWLGDSSLSMSLSAMPKGFTVNVMDDRVMAGLRLFPCKARSDRNYGQGGRSAEFKRRYVGVSSNYFLLLCPYSNRHHLLEVKLIRYLQDISRITFKRNRPEVVTFEVLSSNESNITPEFVVCLMPDGLTECVALIKEYLAEGGLSEEVGSSSPQGIAASSGQLESDVGNDRQDVEEAARVSGHSTSPVGGNTFFAKDRTEYDTHTALGSHAQKPTDGTQASGVEGRHSVSRKSLDGESEEFGEFQAAPRPG